MNAADAARHLPLVRHVLMRVTRGLPPHVDRDDLYGAGCLGLLNAIERYDPTRGVSFGCFASRTIRGAMSDALRRQDWCSRGGRLAMKRGVAPPMTARVGLLDRAGDDGDPAALAERAEEDARLRRRVRALPPRLAYIVEQYYWGGRRLRAIGDDLGVSDTRVSQLKKRAVNELRETISMGVKRCR